MLERFSSKCVNNAPVRTAFGVFPSSALAEDAVGFITDGAPYVRSFVDPIDAFHAGYMLFVFWSYLIEVGRDGRVVGVAVNVDRETDMQALELSLEDLDPEKEADLWVNPEPNSQLFGPDTGERYR